MKARLELEGMEFYARHGCLESERLAGNLFTVDVRASIPADAAAASDDLADAVDYGRIYTTVAREMAVPSKLLEQLAARILGALEKDIPELEDLEVRVSKRRPPVDGVCAWSRITVRR